MRVLFIGSNKAGFKQLLAVTLEVNREVGTDLKFIGYPFKLFPILSDF